MPITTCRAFVVGHSFVRRAGQFYRQRREGIQENLGMEGLEVRFTDSPEEKISNVKQLDMRLRQGMLTNHGPTPDIVVLNVGGNDLCDESVMPSMLAEKIFEIAEKIINSGVQAVYIMFILPRAPTSRWRHMTRADFNEAAATYNQALTQLTKGGSSSRIHSLAVEGFVRDFVSKYRDSDGVHCSEFPLGTTSHSGVFKYLMTIKRVAAQTMKWRLR